MAKKTVVTNESLQAAKERVKKTFRPSDEDPVVRFIENGKMGLRHLMSEEVVEAPTKDFIEIPDPEVIAAKEDVWEGTAIKKLHDRRVSELLDKLGDKYKREYDSSEVQYYPPFDNYYIFEEKESGKICVVNDKGEVVIPPIYFGIHYESWFDEKTYKQMYLTDILKMCKVDENHDLVYGYVKLDGTEVVPAMFQSGAAFKEIMKHDPPMSEIPEWGYKWRTELFRYYDEKNDLYGIQTRKGKKLTEAVYKEVMSQSFVGEKRFFEVRMKKPVSGSYFDVDFYGLVDETGSEILSCDYDEDGIRVDKEVELIFARKKRKQGVFGLDGTPIVKCAYSSGCWSEGPGIITAYTNKDVTLFNHHGQIIIDKGQYDRIKSFKDGLLYARDMDCKWWYIDLWGNKMAK